jgi:hypothetical protein
MSSFYDIIEGYLTDGDATAASVAAQELCVQAEICE